MGGTLRSTWSAQPEVRVDPLAAGSSFGCGVLAIPRSRVHIARGAGGYGYKNVSDDLSSELTCLGLRLSQQLAFW